MFRKHLAHYVLAGALALGVLTYMWNKVLAEKATTKSLGGPDRYLTALSTDKPIYKPGEKIYVRGVVLNAQTRQPFNGNEAALVEIKGPKGDTVASGYANPSGITSVWGFSWEIPGEQPGGEYTLHVSYPASGNAPAERKFDIRAYRAPRLKSQIVFLRDGYGPGEKVTATLHTERAEGGIPAGARVTVLAHVDGLEVAGPAATIDASGNCTATFDLPREIPRGDGTLALVIEDGGVVETASKTIPILLQSVDVKLYPEGGDLVAGLPNRVYFEARTSAQKPADIAGVIIDKDGKELASFRSEHEGRGRFEFSPGLANSYALKITEPAGIKTTVALPAVKAEGVILRSDENMTSRGKPVSLQIACQGYDKVKVTLSHREVELDTSNLEYHKERTFKDGLPFVARTLNPGDADGVLIATVWDEKGTPLAERLIYRQPAKSLNISVTADKKSYVPGDAVTLIVKATDADGKPLAAVVGLTATDESVLEMIEKREQAPRLPLMVLLETEVKELADAQIYMDEKNPKAPLALDLLLGTQGWRRFAFVDAEKFIGDNGDSARRVLALRMSSIREHCRPCEPDAAAFEGAGKFRGAVPVPAAMAAPPPMAQPAQNGQKVKGEIERLERAKDMLAADKPVEAKQMQAAMAKADDRENNRRFLAEDAKKAQRDYRQDFIAVREYAHAVRPNRNPNDRIDFTETVYWNAGIQTDAKTGEARVTFALNDSVTSFRVYADAYGSDGALGSTATAVQSVQPFYAEPKLPLEVTSGDIVLLPVGIVNSIASDLAGATVSARLTGEFKIADVAPFTLNAMERVRQLIQIKVGTNNGPSEFVLNAQAGPYSDKVVRTLSVKPRGFPIEAAFGGLLGPDKAAAHTIVIPDGVVGRSMTTQIAIYPTPLANMTEALKRLIMDPSGCFEQTSSTSYPLTMAQQYFQSHSGVDPKLIEESRSKLDAGYKRLVGFWCPDRGYEWFGENPGHEALTAFGLLHFTDMAAVRDVDRNMIDTTRAWLMKQRDGKGGFERKRRALHTWIEDKDCSNAYITWALLETGAKDLQAEIASLKTAAAASQNSYVIALAANVMSLSGDSAEARKLMDKLVVKQNAGGGVDGGTASIVGSGGETLAIETTALATLAWLRDPNYADSVEKSIKFLADSCKAGRYGSTQSTVLALRAIVTYDKQRARPKAPRQGQNLC